MEETELRQILHSIIDDITHETVILTNELFKAPILKAPCRRARKITLNLAKLYKRFRKVSCDLGLK